MTISIEPAPAIEAKKISVSSGWSIFAHNQQVNTTTVSFTLYEENGSSHRVHMSPDTARALSQGLQRRIEEIPQ